MHTEPLNAFLAVDALLAGAAAAWLAFNAAKWRKFRNPAQLLLVASLALNSFLLLGMSHLF